MTTPNSEVPQFLNNAAENKFKVDFSNIPNFVKYSNIDIMFNRFVRGVTLPAYDLELEERNHAGSMVYIPISRKNTESDELTITFGADEKFLNYYNWQYYIKTLRYGQRLPEANLSRNLINEITVFRLDNESREVRFVKYIGCFPVNLSQLTMKMGVSDMPEYDVSFKYTEMELL